MTHPEFEREGNCPANFNCLTFLWGEGTQILLECYVTLWYTCVVMASLPFQNIIARILGLRPSRGRSEEESEAEPADVGGLEGRAETATEDTSDKEDQQQPGGKTG